MLQFVEFLECVDHLNDPWVVFQFLLLEFGKLIDQPEMPKHFVNISIVYRKFVRVVLTLQYFEANE